MAGGIKDSRTPQGIGTRNFQMIPRTVHVVNTMGDLPGRKGGAWDDATSAT